MDWFALVLIVLIVMVYLPHIIATWRAGDRNRQPPAE